MNSQHDVLMQDPEFRKLLAIESLTAEAAELIAGLMVEKGMSKADLARTLNKSRAWVTQLLRGSTNMTVRTLAEVVFALGGEVKLHAVPAAQPCDLQSPPAVVHSFEFRNVEFGQPATTSPAYHIRQPATTSSPNGKGSEFAA
jgi:transcriptional regulator with XRE-family HTH domain